MKKWSPDPGRRRFSRFWLSRVFVCLVLLLTVLLVGCAPPPAPVAPPKPDPAKEAWYGETADQLAVLNRQAEGFLSGGKPDRAAAIVTQGQSLASRLLAAPQPTLPAMEAVSDLDDLYGRMLLANRHYGWARLLFQKNQSRWTHWRPQTPDTARRRKLAESRVAECDRGLAQ